ncbi:hypothetical protein CXF72_18015 [Psychromonas sp. MB-3u-54]|uniref:Spy/CpxP family protein refolding chaperone n=1 Tax=Psychromonas sp. MB-3u-54 TaxID=2058319 RepID=UPI000C346339|nr:Spy/CpxP family protein refolding chaperone [Psychromonas sp. MB-3u-54]PKH01178.1 hypothetical protein CXF72_18015 [Psychromonas sp. MB-3u-54]
MNNKIIKTMLLVLTVSVTGTSYVAAHAQQHASEGSSMGMMGMGSVDSEEMRGEYMHGEDMDREDMHGEYMHGEDMDREDMHGEYMHGEDMGMGEMSMNFSQLNLTDQQKQKIQAITVASINGNHQNMGYMQVHHADMQTLLNNTVFDENKAKTLMAEHHKQMGERMLAMLKMQHQIFQLLNNQQKEQLTDMQNNNSYHH